MKRFFFTNYVFTEKHRNIVRERIATRLTESKQTPRYYGKDITVQEAIELINFRNRYGKQFFYRSYILCNNNVNYRVE